MPQGDQITLPEGSPLTKIILLIVLVVLNGLFAMSEIAVISFNDNKLKHLAQEGNKKAKILVKLTSEPSKFLATIQVGVTISGLLSSAVAADTFTDYIVYWMRNVDIAPSVVRMISLILITFVLAYINLVFGELVPKRIAMNNPEKTSFRVAGTLRVTSAVTRPFVTLLSASTNGILRLIGVDPNKADNEVTEEEIRMMIDVGEEDGTIDDIEREMLHNIFEFDDRTAGDVMTHRTELVAIGIDSTIEDVIENAVQSGHSRIPVYKNGLDNIVGMLYIKDLLSLVVKKPEQFDINDYMRPVMYLPESARCNDIFAEFRTTKVQLAVVVDEYGGTAGVVTMEDLLETIVGSIQDEYDEELDEIIQINENEYLLEGTVLIEEVSEELEIKFDEGDYDTLAGFVTDKLRHLPQSGEYVDHAGYRFTVTETSEHRIVYITAVRLEPDTPPNDAPTQE
jgi:Hemolysins and related proteins containing CBS domains